MNDPNNNSSNVEPVNNNAKKPRGFALLDPAKRAEVSRKGGKAAHAAGTAYEWTSDAARVAGRKGGEVSHANRRNKDAAAQ